MPACSVVRNAFSRAYPTNAPTAPKFGVTTGIADRKVILLPFEGENPEENDEIMNLYPFTSGESGIC